MTTEYAEATFGAPGPTPKGTSACMSGTTLGSSRHTTTTPHVALLLACRNSAGLPIHKSGKNVSRFRRKTGTHRCPLLLSERAVGGKSRPTTCLRTQPYCSTCCGRVGMLKGSRELMFPKRQGWVQMLRRSGRCCHSWRVSCPAKEKSKGLDVLGISEIMRRNSCLVSRLSPMIKSERHCRTLSLISDYILNEHV